MSAPATVRSATNRLVALTALRWLPVGLTTPVMVLLALSRGLSLAEVGLVFLVHGLVVLCLELPTGGLADVLGRRPVVVAGALLHLLACLIYATAHSFTGFLVGVLVVATGRALDSGPVEAWYVDTVHELDPRADVAPGLARHSAADGAGLSLGAVAGGFLGSGSSLAAPYLAAAVLDLVFVVAVLRWLHEERPPREGSVRSALAAGARDVPRTVAESVRMSVTDGPMRKVLLLTGVGGVGLVACELQGPQRFAELAGGADEGTAVYGTVLAIAFALAAAGALAATPLRRLLHGSTRATCAVLALLGGASLALLAGPDLLVVAAVVFTGYYIAHGAGWPLLSAVLHSRVSSAHRATAVSAMSLAMAVGGLLGNLVVPALPADVAFLAVGGVVALSALVALRLPAAGDQERLRHDVRAVAIAP